MGWTQRAITTRISRLGLRLVLLLAYGCDDGLGDGLDSEGHQGHDDHGDHEHPEGPEGHDSDDDEPADPGEALPLVEAEAWQIAEASDDPLADERPAVVECPAAAWGLELGGLEVQTGTCNYFYARQASLAAIEPGDAVEVVVFHDRLDAAEPAEGHVAILLGAQVVWEEVVAIPSEAAVLEGRWIAQQAWPAGTPVGLHLHNHGYNAWTVLEVSVVPGG